MGVVVGNRGYYSKVSGRKWVRPPKINNHHYIIKITNLKPTKENGTGGWITSNESLMTSVG